MSKGTIETVAGAAMIAAGAALTVFSKGGSIGMLLIQAGSGLVLAGVGTLLSKGPMQGFATSTRNPVAPHDVIYGRARVSGTMAYLDGPRK